MINTNNINTNGFTNKTMEHLLIDSGAIYKNFGLPDQALVGATSGGNEFDVKTKMRQIKVDGVKAANAKGLELVDSVTTTLKCTFIEMTEEILASALTANIDRTADDNYDVISGKIQIDDSDYIKNLALVGTLSGSSKPIIILIENALCLDGLQLKTQDSKDNTVAVTFTAHADPANPDALPYKIYYPKITSDAFTLSSAAVSSGNIVLTMSDIVNETLYKDGFTVTVADKADAITAIKKGNDAKTIEITLTTAPTSGQSVTISYAKPADTSKQVKSENGVVLEDVAVTNVINN
ncbi:hypothetical protein BJV85_000101 [Clostridium acetobutylicum]|uniref:Uncharacterized protein n=1 Tax=Clostridium acetobutylicum (strain ATCC 824 / DSM 792 / JCM 1419 / IAM 19013 / LMG 5710 / NBRC 13948 / NRRL B-527 / VKM B-1787 / 2291 / W) TaxID=272562 RepID=Q97MY3_CLOAB|nr:MULTISPECIES: SwmB domain-containing protein [Clostridium]AAK78043.1 Hypothetical protein CA_C0057 [Clostridium acetobutylicum ATCC 824]ADZ19099.1 hypothetical protein CEA_G0056 [Clostridium acetobutylicum EA 2018]AEI31039.1 hypothetical protein SMB_G0057 [Clostridium acetobutylicum DSM 1731]AWV81894.1 hypothetical protein DK921_17770 [Clostridium acetobutylicum]MBC2395444.1 hypothetical protein [Clostridium acetobutylicum]